MLQVRLPKLEHLAVESSCAGPVRLVAVDGLPCMLAQRSAPALRRVALKGLSQVPLSTARASQRRRSSPTSAR